MIGVVLVDDHRLVRAGLRGIVESADDLVVVGEAADGREALQVARTADPDVVLMDLSMPGMDGVEATATLRREGIRARVVVLTSFVEPERVATALRAGAVGYLLKDSDPAEVLTAIRAAAAGHSPIDARVAGVLLPSQAAADPVDVLSARERQVLVLVAQGLANKQIGRALGISERTVKAHLGSVFRQIGVADRTSAALWARDHHIAPEG
ncbi:MAG: response regulator transcription factor [Dermatophilaceae bacterium]